MIGNFLVKRSRRFKAIATHLLVTCVVTALAALIVFFIWFPYPYRIISGGQHIFLILVGVDVVIGPLLTILVATPIKPQKTLTKDLLVIAILQIAALSYGLFTVFEARPVHTVFERDRFQVVHAVDIPQGELYIAPTDIDPLPISGPTFLSLRAFRDSKEEMEFTFQSTVGLTLAAQPSMWIPLERDKAAILAKAKPIQTLRAFFPTYKNKIDSAVNKTGLPESKLAFLPLVSRQAFWTVLIDTKTAKPVAYIDLDPYEVTTVK